MKTRREFARALAPLTLTHTERAIALLWYYSQTQAFDERTAAELATDLYEEDFPRPNVTRLHRELTRSRFTIHGRRTRSFQLDVRRLANLDDKYAAILKIRRVQVRDHVVDADAVAGTRVYLERLVQQINGSYEFGFFDGCGALCRRLMESLLIDVYLSRGRQHEIRHNGVFKGLDAIIAHARQDSTIPFGRNSGKIMDDVKGLGDTAAHDRTYITTQIDIDDLKARYRRLVTELLVQAGVKK